MESTLSEVWGQVEAMLSAGVSVIPVRDKEQDGKPPKTPFARWKDYQTRIITPGELWHQMELHNTTAVAMICGAVSGNLEAIDIDVKNWTGIDGKLFSAYREMYPEIFSALRIHSTPSGGYHILYRVSGGAIPGNQKLATASNSTQAGIETRGEGGYIVAPPSLGYQVFKDNPIPVLTTDQRESLINVAKSLNERIKIITPPTVAKNKSDYYDQNPFEHYNGSPAAESVLIDNGWTEERTHSRSHRYWIRPGKDKGISASYDVGRRLYYIFTTSTNLEAERGYHPATLLAHLKFNGDKRATYQHLVEQGYGKINIKVETKLVRARVLAGDELPANASEQAKVIYLQTKDYLQRTYVHGVYWVQEDDGVVKINRERLYSVSAGMGFRYYNGSIIRICEYTVSRCTSRQFFDLVKAYCVEAEPDYKEAIFNAWEAFIQRAGEFSITRLQELDEALLLSSTRTSSVKCFRNCYVLIDGQGSHTLDYADLAGKLVWAEQIQDRDYRFNDKDLESALYYQYLQLAIGITPYLWQLIGYLTHDYKDETMGYMINGLDACEDPKQGGGSGKNLFCNLLGHSSTLKTIPGSQLQRNEKCLQAWNFERILVISDVPRRFDYGFFKELSTGTGVVKRLYKDDITVGPSRMPKLVFLTNFSYDISDGGLKRRIMPLEFTDFFTLCGGIQKHFGKLFPYDWDDQEWSAFDNIIIAAIQHYLANQEIIPPSLSASGWLKQFDQNHMRLTREFIEEHWEYWQRVGFISHEKFKYDYDRFCVANNIGIGFRLASHGMNAALQDWCSWHQVQYLRDWTQRENSVTTRGRWFGQPPPF